MKSYNKGHVPLVPFKIYNIFKSSNDNKIQFSVINTKRLLYLKIYG